MLNRTSRGILKPSTRFLLNSGKRKKSFSKDTRNHIAKKLRQERKSDSK